MFSENKVQARKRYREFMADQDILARSAVYATIDQRLQGDDDFIDDVQKLTEQRIEPGKKKKEHSLQKIAAVVQHVTGVKRSEMQSETRQSTVTGARRIVSIIAAKYGYKKVDIARYLRKDPAAVTLYLKGAQNEPGTEAAAEQMLEKNIQA